MISAAIVSPVAAAATQGAAPQGAAAPGGVFAALFVALADRPPVDAADAAGMPSGDGDANALALLQGAMPGATPLAEPGSDESVPEKNADTSEDGTPFIVPPLPLAVGPATENGPQSELAPPAQPPPVAPPLLASTPAPEAAHPAPAHAGAPDVAQFVAAAPPAAVGDIAPSPVSKEPTSLSSPPVIPAAAQNPEAVLFSAPTSAPAEMPIEAPLAPLPLQTAAKANRPAPTGTNAPSQLPATDDSTADAETPQLHAILPAKRAAPAVADVKASAGEMKPAPTPTATIAGSTATTIFTAPAAPDGLMPLPVNEMGSQVKTVPLSNIGNLPSGAAVTAIGAVIASEAAADTSRFLIRLDPPELGRIDVRLRFGRDGEVHARLIADRPETASLLMRDAAVLERALNASGMRTDSGVDVMLRDSSGGFARSGEGSGGESPPTYRPLAATLASMPENPVWTRPTLAGRLDLTV